MSTALRSYLAEILRIFESKRPETSECPVFFQLQLSQVFVQILDVKITRSNKLFIGFDQFLGCFSDVVRVNIFRHGLQSFAHNFHTEGPAKLFAPMLTMWCHHKLASIGTAQHLTLQDRSYLANE